MSITAVETITFGPHRLIPALRTIERDGAPIELGSRALDILILLVERAGEVVPSKELLSRVWRGVFVGPACLRVHMAGLRQALNDGRHGARYIANIRGQGYSFVAPVARTRHRDLSRPTPGVGDIGSHAVDLPLLPRRVIGRDEAIATVAEALVGQRFVTILGPGGIGKTTVAVSVARVLLDRFCGAILYVDLASLSDPTQLAAAIAKRLGIETQSIQTPCELIGLPGSAPVLLLLDNCEHLIDTVANLSEQISHYAPQVHILTTSREALRVEGEHVHYLPPLASPAQATSLTAAEARKFPAVQLFMDRAQASGGCAELSDEEVLTVAQMCDSLDGIALAIELVASRVGTYGIEGTAGLLGDIFKFHWRGRRTAAPRHQTLNAMLDWSYELLPESEQALLRNLSVIGSPFTISSARSVSCANDWSVPEMAQTLSGLVAKSLLSAATSGGVTSYRMLNITRAYAAEKNAELQRLGSASIQTPAPPLEASE